MPVFRNRTAFEIARGVRAFLNLEAGITRSGPPEGKPARKAPATDNEPGVRPENMVWIFGSGRSGSNWLRRMMGELEGHAIWNEPMLGELFGNFYEEARQDQLPSTNYIFGEPMRESWLNSIRNFVLEGAHARYPQLTPQDYLVIKESTATVGASLLLEALLESRVILLVRDPRDIVASTLDASKRGSWMHQRIGNSRQAQIADVAEQRPNEVVNSIAEGLAKNVLKARQAYDAHQGPKALVRYEDLLSDTLGTMHRLYRELGLSVGEEELARTVEKHSWENIPEDQKGEGKFYRKGTPGGWKEDLTFEQVEIVEEVAAPILEEFYPEGGKEH